MAKRINPPLGQALHEAFRVEAAPRAIPASRVGVPDAIREIDEIMAELGEAQKSLVVSYLARKYSGGGK